MKKIMVVLLVICMTFCFISCGKKEEAGIDVFVSISVKGDVQLAAAKTRVVDLNNDGIYTIDEALYAAHKANAPSKADSYATEEGQYGLAITKLWDDANGMSGYGYCVNNVSAMNLSDEVKEGDYVYAYSYKDLTYWSDTYTWFDKFETKSGDITLHLYKMSYDANWNPVSENYSGAKILVDGIALGTTDGNGLVTLNIAGSKNDTVVVTAYDANGIIVPAICIVTSK